MEGTGICATLSCRSKHYALCAGRKGCSGSKPAGPKLEVNIPALCVGLPSSRSGPLCIEPNSLVLEPPWARSKFRPLHPVVHTSTPIYPGRRRIHYRPRLLHSRAAAPSAFRRIHRTCYPLSPEHGQCGFRYPTTRAVIPKNPSTVENEKQEHILFGSERALSWR
jgi:hypothetical protein